MSVNLDYLTPEFFYISYQRLANSGMPKNFIATALQLEVIRLSFGEDFFNRECTNANENTFFKHLDDPNLLNFSSLIWQLRKCEGLTEFIERNTNEDIESIYYELFAAKFFL